MFHFLKTLPLTAKLAAIIVAVNLCGISALATYTWMYETRALIDGAKANWSKDAEQFASVAAGGVKWGKANAVREAYSLYRDDPSLDLVNLPHSMRTSPPSTLGARWHQRSARRSRSSEEPKCEAGKTTVDDSGISVGVVTIIAPLPLDKAGKITGYVVTNWSVEKIAAEVKHKVLISLLTQSAITAIAVAAFLLAMRSTVGRPIGSSANGSARCRRAIWSLPLPTRKTAMKSAFSHVPWKFSVTRRSPRSKESKQLPSRVPRSTPSGRATHC